MKKRILLLDGYNAASHQTWHQGLTDYLGEYNWTVITLPARHFSWRIRGSALSFATHYRAQLEMPYDLLICTSMVDLAALRGLVPNLAQCHCLLYFHENQFVYPVGEAAHSMLEAQMVTIYSAMAADELVFNSEFNRESFINGVEQLFRKLPDFAPKKWGADAELKSRVIPVPIHEAQVALHSSSEQRNLQEGITIVWNHRWEYDKGPDRLLAGLRQLVARRVTFSLHLVGQQFRREPSAFAQIKEEFSSQLSHFGFVRSRDDYFELLARSDVVLSTAVHEFQGLAVLEAVAHGCVPVVPRRLSYTTLFEEKYLYDSFIEAPDKEAEALAKKIENIQQNLFRAQPVPVPSVKELYWSNMVIDYRALIERFIA